MMNNPYVQRVYQKLAHARLLLAQAEACGTTIPERQQADALLQAALLHLAIGYRFYLRELAQGYRLPQPDMIIVFEELQQRLAQDGRCLPELDELQCLIDADSWLSAMLAAEQDVLNPAVTPSKVQQVGVIAVSGAGGEPLTESGLALWLEGLNELSERQRANGTEY